MLLYLKCNNHIRPHKFLEDERKIVTQALVIADPPTEAARPHGPRKPAELIITEPIATGHDRGSQVAREMRSTLARSIFLRSTGLRYSSSCWTARLGCRTRVSIRMTSRRAM